MVKAIFLKKYFASIFCLCCGLFLFVMFILCIINGVTDVIPGIIFASFCTIGGLISLFFNHKAELVIEDGHIKGKYHLFGKISCNVSDVEFALAQINVLTIQLKNGKVYRIFGVSNSWVLCSAIRRDIDYHLNESPETLIKKLNICKSDRKKDIVYVCIGIALMFVYIFATAILTEWKDLSEFNKNERLGFYIFCIAEAITFFVTMLIANKAGKKILSIEKTQYDVRKRIIETSALLLGNVIKIYSDEEYRIRVTLFGYPNSDSVYYTVESIGYDYLLNKVNESQILEDTKHLPEEFESLIDISEKFGI